MNCLDNHAQIMTEHLAQHFIQLPPRARAVGICTHSGQPPTAYRRNLPASANAGLDLEPRWGRHRERVHTIHSSALTLWAICFAAK
jgi:hypothetical protein